VNLTTLAGGAFFAVPFPSGWPASDVAEVLPAHRTWTEGLNRLKHGEFRDESAVLRNEAANLEEVAIGA
jgi:hypothetical protein